MLRVKWFFTSKNQIIMKTLLAYFSQKRLIANNYVVCALLTCIAFCVGGCNKTTVENVSPTNAKLSQQEKLDNLLEKAGFNKEKIVDFGEYMVYDNEVVLTKSDFTNRIKQCEASNSNAKVDQWVLDSDGIVNYSKVQSMSFRIDPSITTIPNGNDWVNAIRQALNDWSNIGQDNINFTETTSANADVTFFSDNAIPLACMQNLNVNTFAIALMPSGGNPGRFVSINDNGPASDFVGKLYIVKHEIGHSLGFRHSDWQDRGQQGDPSEPVGFDVCGISYYGANLLSKTQEFDNNSVFNAFATGFDDIDFSNDDRVSARMLYPNSLQINQSVTVSSFHNIKQCTLNNLDSRAAKVLVYAEKITSYKPLIKSFVYKYNLKTNLTNSVFFSLNLSDGYTGRIYYQLANYKEDYKSNSTPIITL
jgi:predicted Zn-dependent protease